MELLGQRPCAFLICKDTARLSSIGSPGLPTTGCIWACFPIALPTQWHCTWTQHVSNLLRGWGGHRSLWQGFMGDHSAFEPSPLIAAWICDGVCWEKSARDEGWNGLYLQKSLQASSAETYTHSAHLYQMLEGLLRIYTLVRTVLSGSGSTSQLLAQSNNTLDGACCHLFVSEPRTCSFQSHFSHCITHVKATRQCRDTIGCDHGHAWSLHLELDLLWITYKPTSLPSLHGKLESIIKK